MKNHPFNYVLQIIISVRWSQLRRGLPTGRATTVSFFWELLCAAAWNGEEPRRAIPEQIRRSRPERQTRYGELRAGEEAHGSRGSKLRGLEVWGRNPGPK
jgi:hypothetical protein